MTKELAPRDKFKQNLELMSGEISKALPSHVDAKVFARVVLTAANRNPKLFECTQASLFGAIMQSAQLGLMPDGVLGQAHMIPYTIKNVMTCNFQIGYKGLITLIRRTGKVNGIVAQAVYEGDVFEYNLMDGVQKHERSDDTVFDDTKITHFYAIIKYKDGGNDFAVLTNGQVQSHMKKFSKGYYKDDSPWKTDYPAMGKKTAIIQAAKYAELSTELQAAISLDEISEVRNQRNSAVVQDQQLGDTHFDNYEEITDENILERENEKEDAQAKTKAKTSEALNNLG